MGETSADRAWLQQEIAAGCSGSTHVGLRICSERQTKSARHVVRHNVNSLQDQKTEMNTRISCNCCLQFTHSRIMIPDSRFQIPDKLAIHINEKPSSNSELTEFVHIFTEILSKRTAKERSEPYKCKDFRNEAEKHRNLLRKIHIEYSPMRGGNPRKACFEASSRVRWI